MTMLSSSSPRLTSASKVTVPVVSSSISAWTAAYCSLSDLITSRVAGATVTSGITSSL